MAIAKIDIVCNDCGKRFTHTHTCRNLREADSYKTWALGHITECPSCYARMRQEASEAKAAELIAEMGIPTDITGVSDKQVALALKRRARYIAENETNIRAIHGMVEQYCEHRGAILAACRANGIEDEGEVIARCFAKCRKEYTVLTSTSAADILDTIGV